MLTFPKIRRRDVSSSIRPRRFFSKLLRSFNSMALSASARPRRKTKKAYGSDFLYDFPSSELFHDHEEDFNLDGQSDPAPHNPPPIIHSAQPAKAKSATAHSAPPLSLSAKDTGPSTLPFDRQFQLIKLQKEKPVTWVDLVTCALCALLDANSLVNSSILVTTPKKITKQ